MERDWTPLIAAKRAKLNEIKAAKLSARSAQSSTTPPTPPASSHVAVGAGSPVRADDRESGLGARDIGNIQDGPSGVNDTRE